jgi:uncharacterized protein (TIGR02996 family)
MARARREQLRVEGDAFNRQSILAAAPDEASIPAAQKVLKKGGFGTVEATADGKGWWVVCRGLTDTYQTSVRIDDGVYACDCTCPSPKYPCKHALALLLYLSEHPEERAEPEDAAGSARDFEALVRTVFQNPDEDTPRLVFADYCDETGQPDRAALIRVQCQLAREKPKSRRAAELKKEEKRLVERLRLQMGTLPEGVRVEFRRGFIRLSANLYFLRELGSLPERFARLFRDGWVETVCVQDYYYDLLTEAHESLLGLAGELDFSGRALSEDAMLSVVARTAGMRASGRLCRVLVSKRDRKLFEQLTAALAGGEAPAALAERLPRDRVHRGLTQTMLELLIRSGRLRNAHRLHLEGPLGDRGAELLAAADLGETEELYLGRWQIGPAGLHALGTAEHLGRLRAFGLDGSWVDPPHAAALARGPVFARLGSLYLGSCGVTDAALVELGKGRTFPALKVLDLESDKITPDGLAEFLRSPHFPALTCVAVGSTRIDRTELLPVLVAAPERPDLSLVAGNLTVRRVCSAAGDELTVNVPTQLRADLFSRLTPASAKRVTALRVERAQLTPAGLRAVAAAFDPAALKGLTFAATSLRNEGAEALVTAFAGYKPEALRLTGCRITATGVAALVNSPLVDSVKTLDLNGNNIGKAGVVGLLKSSRLGSLGHLFMSLWGV